jgi:hypothetical protein
MLAVPYSESAMYPPMYDVFANGEATWIVEIEAKILEEQSS